jgi:hypothetical protein
VGLLDIPAKVGAELFAGAFEDVKVGFTVGVAVVGAFENGVWVTVGVGGNGTLGGGGG